MDFTPSMTGPGTPLHQLSPERMNRQNPFQSANGDVSMSLKSSALGTHSARPSDVQSKVAAFNTLSNTPTKRGHSAATQRELLGREEADSQLRRLKEDLHRLHVALDESETKRRELENISVTVKQKCSELGARNREMELYLKKKAEDNFVEQKRLKKENMYLSSEVIKYKNSCNQAEAQFSVMRSEVEKARQSSDVYEKESLEAQAILSATQYEVQNLQRELKLAQEERDALKESLKKEEVARIAAGGRIQLPPSRDSDEFASPIKLQVAALRRNNQTFEASENDDANAFDESEYLPIDLSISRYRVKQLEDLIDFMEMEKQFRDCFCRCDEQATISNKAIPETVSSSLLVGDLMDDVMSTPRANVAPSIKPRGDLDDFTSLISFSPTKTFSQGLTISAVAEEPSLLREPEEPALLQFGGDGAFDIIPRTGHVTVSSTIPLRVDPDELPRRPQTPTQDQPKPFERISYLETSTTTKVPLSDSQTETTHYPRSPGSQLTTEEKLALIEQRRGRAKSMALQNTPKKPVQATPKRNGSAPALKIR